MLEPETLLFWPRSHDEPASARSLIKNTLKMSSPRQLFYKNSEFVRLEVRLDKQVIRPLLPAFMKLTNECRGVFFVAKHQDCAFAEPYLEAGLLVEVKTILGVGFHFLWAVVDSDLAMILGRETLGVPKKKAQITWQDHQGVIDIQVQRRGETLFSAKLGRGKAQLDPLPVLGQRFYNVGGMASCFMLQTIWTYRSREEILAAEQLHTNGLDRGSWGGELQHLIDAPIQQTAQYSRSHIYGTRWLLPAGIAGPEWLAKSFELRYL